MTEKRTQELKEQASCPHCAEEGTKAEEMELTAGEQKMAEPAKYDTEYASDVPDCCRHKSQERAEKEYKDLLNRLSRIEGQVRGVRKMLEGNAYCIDIMTQVMAINSALNSFNKVILTNHMQTCVTDDIRDGGEEKMDELLKLLPKLMK